MKPLHWTLDEVAEITGGSILGDPRTVITSVDTDSRAVTEGSLFVAIVGERFDGHRFAHGALTEGATAALVSEATTDLRPAVVVEDTLTALLALATSHRAALRGRVIAVTGSTGKTSTKDLLAGALADSHVSPRSYNNEVGVPLTVLSAPTDAPYVVVEVGSRGVGHIDLLMPAVRPDVAVITNLGVVHLETFGTEDRLADAKWELAAAVGPHGTIVLPDNEPRLRRPTQAKVITFGSNGTVSISEISADDDGCPSFGITYDSATYRVTLSMSGRHQAYNAAAAFAAAVAAGATAEDVVTGLGTASGSAWRMEIHHGTFTVVNDAYNANPDSMRSAIETVADMSGRHLAIVGEMAELGTVAVAEHRMIGQLLKDRNYEGVIVVGDEPGIAQTYGDRAVRVTDTDEAVRQALALIRPGDVVLVKASRSIGLDRVATQLIEAATS
jgi:UDP-N-acetylmuramoyl-tripeptide--D-alanyl-D-alanine ligase